MDKQFTPLLPVQAVKIFPAQLEHRPSSLQ
jgi:hypothetical protein